MSMKTSIQLSQLIDMNKPRAIIAEVKRIFLYTYNRKYFARVKKGYSFIQTLFKGRIPGYKSCNTYYHDLSHTLLTLLACARLLDGCNLTNKLIPPELASDLLFAALFHDVGYIQEDWDKEGTGAKFTKYHIERSVEFLMKNKEILKLKSSEIPRIQKLIRCTGIVSEIYTLEFDSDEEKLAGAMLGTADLLGQMSDRAYLEKLLFLYYEFREAGIDDYKTEFDIIRKTLSFYELIKEKFNKSFMNTHQFAHAHFNSRFGIDRNLYIEAIDHHLEYTKKVIADSSTNFRDKLHRANWVEEYIYS
jgi:hypothetical protein